MLIDCGESTGSNFCLRWANIFRDGTEAPLQNHTMVSNSTTMRHDVTIRNQITNNKLVISYPKIFSKKINKLSKTHMYVDSTYFFKMITMVLPSAILNKFHYYRNIEA